jgi:hypothetical protein
VKKLWIIPIVLLTRSSLRAQYYGSTDYSIERWTEDYSYLKDVDSFSDPFDRLKYLPINRDKDWYVSLGGQARYRFDLFNNLSFGAVKDDNTGFDLLRFYTHADLHFGQNLRFFLEFNSALSYDRLGGPRVGDADDFDIQQAFADVRFPFAENSALTVRVGRQELIYGAQRLISPNDWGNVRLTFEGVKGTLNFRDDTLDAFLVRPVEMNKSHFNSGNDNVALAGIYNVIAFPRLLPDANAKLDTYLFLLDRSASATDAVSSDTFTLGVRPHINPGNWDFDLEADWQFGNIGDHAIGAYAVATEAGYTFNQCRFSPRAGLGFDLASGSANSAHRFNQLFPPLYLYLGHLYRFGRQNIMDLHPEVAVNLTDAVTLNVAEHLFWRQNTHDAIYDLTGAVVRAGNTSSSRTIGNEFDISLNYQINKHFSAYTGYGHLFTGPFLRETGAHQDIDFFYASATFTF